MNNQSTLKGLSSAEYISLLFDAHDLVAIMLMRNGEKPQHIFKQVSDASSPEFMTMLRKQNEAGYNIFLCMNPLTAERRVKENVQHVRTLYLDIDQDGATRLKKIAQSELVPRPHFVIQSSPGRFYVVWGVDRVQPNEQERMLDALIQEFGGDPAASDRVRVLRLPGFVNHKYDSKPVVEVIENRMDRMYGPGDFKVKVAPAVKLAEKIPATIEAGKRNDLLTSLAGTMRRRGASEGAILAALQETNRNQCQPPLNDAEVATIAKSVSRYAPAQEPQPTQSNPTNTVATAAKPTAATDVHLATVGIKDMPESVLDGWLGEVCKSRMLAHFPVAYAWPALITVASAMVPASRAGRCNLYTASVGPIHSGKSEAITHAKLLLGIQKPPLMDSLVGSGEMLTDAVGDAEGKPALYSTDELGHLLEKAQIQNSSFVYLLNRAFYETGFTVRSMQSNGKARLFNAILSVLGGVVDERFGELFTSKTVGGLYDRFLFGLCPTDFQYFYLPFEGGPVLDCHDCPVEGNNNGGFFSPPAAGDRPVPIRVDSSAFEEINRWKREDEILKNPDCARLVEIALRVAVICASFDGRDVLYGKDLGPAFQMARYQARIRGVLKPNPGKTFEGQLFHKFFEYLTMHTSNGEWVSRRDLFRNTRAGEIGLPVANKTLDAMIANEDVEELILRSPSGPPKRYVRVPLRKSEV